MYRIGSRTCRTRSFTTPSRLRAAPWSAYRSSVQSTPLIPPRAYHLLTRSRSQDLDDPEVTPPTALLDHAQVLREVMAVYASSLLGDESAAESAAGFARILDTAVDPAVQMCTNAAAEKQRLRPLWDQAVFVLNCLTYLLVRVAARMGLPPRLLTKLVGL